MNGRRKVELRVLVVEDIPRTLSGTLAELSGAGVPIDIAGSVEAALIFLQDTKYDAMLLDWRLPMSAEANSAVDDDAGGKLLSALSSGKAGLKNRKVPVIILTAQRSGIDFTRVDKYKNCAGAVSKMGFDEMEKLIGKVLGIDLTW